MLFRSLFPRPVALALLLLVGAVWRAACNTTEGFGRDMSPAGHSLSKSAEKSK